MAININSKFKFLGTKLAYNRHINYSPLTAISQHLYQFISTKKKTKFLLNNVTWPLVCLTCYIEIGIMKYSTEFMIKKETLYCPSPLTVMQAFIEHRLLRSSIYTLWTSIDKIMTTSKWQLSGLFRSFQISMSLFDFDMPIVLFASSLKEILTENLSKLTLYY